MQQQSDYHVSLLPATATTASATTSSIPGTPLVPPSPFPYDIGFELLKVDRQDRIADQMAECCKHWRYHFNRATRKVIKYPLRCNRWREGCPNCLGLRVEEIRKGVESRLRMGDLRMLEISDSRSDIDNFIRRSGLSGKDVTRYPTERGEVLFIDEDKARQLEVTGGRTISITDQELSVDFEMIARTPIGRNRSGTLVKYVPELPAPKIPAEIQVEDFRAEFEDDQREVHGQVIERLAMQALEEDPYEPKDIEELQASSRAWFSRFVRLSSEHGIAIVVDRLKTICVDFCICSERCHIENQAPEGVYDGWQTELPI